MRNFTHFLYTLAMSLFLLVGMTSCEIVGGIFKAGAWTGAILVIAVIVLVIWGFSRLFGGRRSD
ncbi:hypothetical protein LX87_01960 [Larkinella arboricola]|uniref:Phosphatidate cytidylyltransferase n=1 Tax=Larkinella arboricola TaxID=643671 RepID=A0A327X2A8_LARAB|nr:hypothetical protein [Larkinella arboricola]RAK00260.1 hypothetical protein LX87_01960 [Larkinella arboricola]